MITLKTLEQATAQEVFDQAVNHLLTQDEKSTYTTPKGYNCCSYRGISEETNKPLKCAAGCFISDDEYKEEMEGEDWFFLVNNNVAPSKHSRLISSLQEIHDDIEVEDWIDSLNDLANTWDLKFNWEY